MSSRGGGNEVRAAGSGVGIEKTVSVGSQAMVVEGGEVGDCGDTSIVRRHGETRLQHLLSNMLEA